jgi:hypothetical protein
VKLPAYERGLRGTAGQRGPDMFCTNCGASNKKDSKFCINCAESLSEVQITERLSRVRVLKKASYLKKVDFLRILFDFSFSQLIAPKVVKFLYGLSILFALLLALSFIVAGFNASTLLGSLALLTIAPLTFLLTAISSRILLEMVLVIFRMAGLIENIRLVNIEENSESREAIQWNV